MRNKTIATPIDLKRVNAITAYKKQSETMPPSTVEYTIGPDVLTPPDIPKPERKAFLPNQKEVSIWSSSDRSGSGLGITVPVSKIYSKLPQVYSTYVKNKRKPKDQGEFLIP
ncbi:MAG: hypothetical protein DKM50_02825 [Candidatus Margulisiibacteriota bacterium]|nr:MAG: hypothetical protein DKM50_02825 [Candidatus Margulisiibacteriota bacterium]HCT86418.1 hypothetical protein [Candidatus Margulisiibacteriota bacterium]